MPDSLDVPGTGWISLDRKLAAALTSISHGEIGRELTQKSTIELNSNRIVRGRVLLALVFQYYASGTSGQVLYDMSHLQSLVMVDNNLEGFHNTWNMVLSELTFVPEKSTLLFWYFKQIQNFKPMAEDIAHFKRAQWNNSSDYSFDWLWGASCRYLAQKTVRLHARVVEPRS